MKMLTEPLWSPLQILVSCRVGWPRRHCYPELQTIRLAILLLKNVQIAILHCLCCLLRNSLFVCTTGCYSKSNVCIGWHLLWLPFGRCETQAEWPTVMQKYLSLVLYPLPWTVLKKKSGKNWPVCVSVMSCLRVTQWNSGAQTSAVTILIFLVNSKMNNTLTLLVTYNSTDTAVA